MCTLFFINVDVIIAIRLIARMFDLQLWLSKQGIDSSVWSAALKNVSMIIKGCLGWHTSNFGATHRLLRLDIYKCVFLFLTPETNLQFTYFNTNTYKQDIITSNPLNHHSPSPPPPPLPSPQPKPTTTEIATIKPPQLTKPAITETLPHTTTFLKNNSYTFR